MNFDNLLRYGNKCAYYIILFFIPYFVNLNVSLNGRFAGDGC